jgi:hypothetical protein
LEEVKEEVSKDEDYKEAIKSLEKGEEMSHGNLNQEKGVVYHHIRFCIPYGLRMSVLESEHDSKVAGHMDQNK